jgi:hypothetical protein
MLSLIIKYKFYKFKQMNLEEKSSFLLSSSFKAGKEGVRG